MLPITVPLARSARSAAALAEGARNAKQFVDRVPHFVGAFPDPIADSTLSSTSNEVGSSRCPNLVRSRAEATRDHAVSRLVPRVTSPPAQTRTGPRSDL